MLRASVENADGAPVELRPVATGCGDTRVAHGAELIAFTDAVVLGDLEELPDARAALESVAGGDVTDRAAMVAGNFSMMNRALDAIGAPIGSGGTAVAAELGVEIPAHLL